MPSPDLPPFEGDWHTRFDFPNDPPGRLTGTTSFERLDGSGLLVMRSRPDPGGPPHSIATIGSDEKSGAWTMLYWDERDVSRIYTMAWDGRTWTLNCRTAHFFQRFEATLSTDGHTLTGAWWASDDGMSWKKDFDVTYRRVVSNDVAPSG